MLTPTRVQQVASDLDTWITLIDILIDDVRTYAEDIDPKRPGRHRSYVRGVFALIEGALTISTWALVEIGDVGGWEITAEERNAVAQIRSSQSTESVQARRRFRSLEERIKSVFAVARRVIGGEAALDLSGVEWIQFCDAVKIRNRITHPKTPADLQVTTAELALMDSVRDWFRFGVMRVLVGVREKIKMRAEAQGR